MSSMSMVMVIDTRNKGNLINSTNDQIPKLTSILDIMDIRDKHWCFVKMNRSGKYLGVVFSHVEFKYRMIVMYGMAVHDVKTGESMKITKRILRKCATGRYFKCPGVFLVGEEEFAYSKRKSLFLQVSRSVFKGPRLPRKLWENRMYPDLEQNNVILGASSARFDWSSLDFCTIMFCFAVLFLLDCEQKPCSPCADAERW